jgi:hypothetical protein
MWAVRGEAATSGAITPTRRLAREARTVGAGGAAVGIDGPATPSGGCGKLLIGVLLLVAGQVRQDRIKVIEGLRKVGYRDALAELFRGQVVANIGVLESIDDCVTVGFGDLGAVVAGRRDPIAAPAIYGRDFQFMDGDSERDRPAGDPPNLRGVNKPLACPCAHDDSIEAPIPVKEHAMNLTGRSTEPVDNAGSWFQCEK